MSVYHLQKSVFLFAMMCSVMCFCELGSMRVISMWAEGGASDSSTADHVTSDTSQALMWSVCVSLETVRQRCKQGDPLPPTDSLVLIMFPFSHHISLHYLKICNIIQYASQSIHSNTAEDHAVLSKIQYTVFVPQNRPI